jgi:hypothetical protein
MRKKHKGIGVIMRTAKKPRTKLRPPTIDQFKSEDLETMRQAFICACHDNPDVSATEPERYDLADAMVSVYHKYLTQRQLVAAAVRKVKKTKSRVLAASQSPQL